MCARIRGLCIKLCVYINASKYLVVFGACASTLLIVCVVKFEKHEEKKITQNRYNLLDAISSRTVPLCIRLNSGACKRAFGGEEEKKS